MEEQALDDLTASLLETEDECNEQESHYSSAVENNLSRAPSTAHDKSKKQRGPMNEEYPENIYDEPHENNGGSPNTESPSEAIREVNACWKVCKSFSKFQFVWSLRNVFCSRWNWTTSLAKLCFKNLIKMLSKRVSVSYSQECRNKENTGKSCWIIFPSVQKARLTRFIRYW